MKFMFYSCINLTELNISSFITQKCQDFMNMFGECNGNLVVYINPCNNSKLIEKIQKYVDINFIYDL